MVDLLVFDHLLTSQCELLITIQLRASQMEFPI